MKNIVIVTWLGGENFGTCLQSYALYKILENCGYNVNYLNYFSGLGLKNFAKQTAKKILTAMPKMNVQKRKRVNFQKENIKTITIFSKKQLDQLIDKTDCFISGSDQIWNTYFAFTPFFFLNFVGNSKRISYASSIGASDIKQEYKKNVKELLDKYSRIGVREKSAISPLQKLTGRDDIVQVLDPTFLLTKQNWQEMSKNAVFEVQIPSRYILCYLIGDNVHYSSQLTDVQKKTGIKDIVIIPSAENPTFNFTNALLYKYASPVEFVKLIQNATFVCTDSFHATALSINHGIPFVEFMRFKDSDVKSQNSRIYDLLEHYNLKDRIFSPESDFNNVIDYNSVQEILSDERKKSFDYLINAIEK